jgi:hypothetical protein
MRLLDEVQNYARGVRMGPGLRRVGAPAAGPPAALNAPVRLRRPLGPEGSVCVRRSLSPQGPLLLPDPCDCRGPAFTDRRVTGPSSRGPCARAAPAALAPPPTRAARGTGGAAAQGPTRRMTG